MKEQQHRYVLTHPQQRIWYTEKLHPGTGMWNNAGTLKIKGRIDFQALETAVNTFIKDNESIRLRVGVEDGTPYQYLTGYQPIKIDYLDFSGEQINKLYEWDSAQTHAPMQLIDRDLFYFTMIKIRDEEGWLYVKFHHIISDGLSIVDFGNQVMDNYQSLLSGKDKPDIKLRSYIEYIRDEKEYLESKRFIYDQQYWTSKFTSLPEPSVIKQKKTNYFSTKAMRKTYVLPEKLSSEIRSFCKDAGISVFALFLSALAVYMNRITGKKEIIIGAPVANRTSMHAKGAFGMYVSTVPVRIEIKDDLTFTEFAQVVSNEWFSVLKHQKYPYDMLIQELRKQHKGLESLYDVTLSYQIGKFEKNTDQFTYEGRWHFNGYQANSLSIHVNDREDNGKFIVDYDHHVPFFSEKEIQYYHIHIGNILQDMIEAPDKQLYALHLMSDEERNRILFEFNKTEHNYPKGETIPGLWYKKINKLAKDGIAAVCGGQSMTYGELDARSSALALYLRKQGVKADSIVGLLVTRTLDYCVSALAILKAGGAFLPIDAELPQERIAYMLSDSGAKALIVAPSLEEKCNGMGIPTIRTNIPLAIPDQPYIEPGCGPNNLAYVIYTSGSTGQPKGVQIEHRSAVNFVYSMNDIWTFRENSRLLCAASFSFDISVMELFLALLNGTTFVLAQEHEVNIPKNMANLITSAKVNMMVVTPGRMELLLTDMQGAACIKDFYEIGMGGDVLTEKLLNQVQQFTRARITNFYGPTEITVCCTCTDVTKAKTPSIGKPMPNAKAYILDKHKNPVPIGVPGELYIGGPGVSRGYINKSDLTEERFIKSPFIAGQNIYRTGDLARWYPHGEIEFLGRIDKQVKIRGYRVELGEIENRIMQVKGVKACAVSDGTDAAGRKYLCAYVIGDSLKKDDIKAQLVRDLPLYMIPSYFVNVDELPFNASGKVDRDKLPDPIKEAVIKEDYIPPETATELILADIWSNVLNTQSIGRNDSFFEIGGDSLSIVSVMSQVVQAFHVDISLEEVYRSPRLSDFAKLIDKAEQSAYRPILPAPSMQDYPVSSAQQRMWVLAQSNPESVAYNIPIAIEIKGKLSIPGIKKALEKIIERHKIFRTTYLLRDGELRQKINNKSGFNLDVIKCEPAELNKTLRSLVKPFDLAKLPAMRAAVIETGKNLHVLFIDMHHISGDKGTTEILLRDLADIFSGRKLMSNTLEYKDYAVWQQESLNSESISMQREYWAGALAGELPLLNLHTDRPRLAVQKFEGSHIRFELKGKVLEGLRLLGQQSGATLFTVLLAVYNVLLSKYTGQEDIIVGSPSSGRKREELEGIAGIFLNTLPLRNYPHGDMSFREFLGELNTNFISAYAHSEYPLERIISDLSIPRDATRNPLFDTMLVYLKGFDKLYLNDIECRQYPFDPGFSKLDMTLEINDEDTALNCQFEYNKRLFRRSSIKRIIKHFCRLVEIVTDQPDSRISEIDMMTPDELRKVIYEFNQTDSPMDQELSIQSVFENIAATKEEKTAVICDGEKISFSKLNERANQIAWWLRDRGVGRNTIVAVCIHRSIDLIAGILGILKAGGAYLPIDTEYPEERIMLMLRDSGAKLVLTDENKLLNTEDEAYMIADVSSDMRKDNLVPIEKMEDAAYVIYTSGSTGLPKGVILPRRGLCNLYESAKSTINYNCDNVCVSVTTVSFDIFIGDTLLPLFYGCTVALCTEEELRQPRLLAALIESVDAKFIQTTPTRMRIMMQNKEFRAAAHDHIDKMLLAGEMIPLSLLRLLKRHTNAKIQNGYGPTETTVYSSFKDLSKVSRVTIGKPLLNTRIYILDRQQRPVPVGVLGEAYISGSGVAVSGYINREELNRSKFLPDPYWPGHTMYQTGDVCALLPNGDIEMSGRIDHQVKVRGLRIELGEIEAAIRGVKGIEEAVVKDWGESVNKYLCAYYVSSSNIGADAIRNVLIKKLPTYMVPSYFILLKEMPTTLNGKVNRKALREPVDERLADKVSKSFEHMSQTEKKMAGVWAKVLKTKNIGPEDNFFALGGDSLGVIKVVSSVYQYGWNMCTKDFYEYQTLRGICGRINKQGNETDEKRRANKKIYIPEYKHLKSAKLNNILITGSTGYLGAHVLENLIKTTTAHIFCLVRSSDIKSGEKYLLKVLTFYFGTEFCTRIIKRITVIKGNISEPKLGLEEADYIDLKKVDTVLHCAAITDHVGQAEVFYNTNVLGTKNVVKFAEEINATLLHVSTMSVSGTYSLKEEYPKEEFSENCLYIGQNYIENEYIKSKFQAEEIVLKAIKKGLDAKIFRVGLLTGTVGGRFQMRPERNAFANRIKAICATGCIPISMVDTQVEMTPVDACAEAILFLSQSDSIQPVFHIYNKNKISLKDLIALLKQAGYIIKVIPDEEYTQTMKSLSRKGEISSLMGLINDINKNEQISGNVSNVLTDKLLEKSGFHWPEIDEAYIGRFIDCINQRQSTEV